MKRDMELVRLILQALEGDQEAKVRSSADYSTQQRAYHVALMIEAGLLIGVTHNNPDGVPEGYFVSRMTWGGHDFLDTMRDDTIWKKAREHVIKPGASWTFDLLKEWAKHEIQQKLGLPVQ